MSASTVAPTDVEPSTLLNVVGLGWDAADANCQIMHNDGAGTCTKIDLGGSFPVPSADRTNVYRLELISPRGMTQKVYYHVTNLTTDVTAEGEITTNLPATSNSLAPRGYMSAGGTSSVVGIGLNAVHIDARL